MDSEIDKPEKENSAKVDHTELPKIKFYTKTIGDKKEFTLYFHLVEYVNAIFVSIYNDIPRLGSMSMAYQIEDNVDTFSIFTGNNNQFANAVAMILSKKKNKLVYGSVHLNSKLNISLDVFRELIDLYLRDI